jgi:hypothetical protein
MAWQLLCQVENRFQIPGRGLVILPSFSVPETGTRKFRIANLEVETPNGERHEFEAEFTLELFPIYDDPCVLKDKNQSMVLIIYKVKKEEVPIGSKVYLSEIDYSKVYDVQVY